MNTPTFFSAFPADIKPAPREFVERSVNLQTWTEHPAGGHFAAWEQPQAYANDLRRACELQAPVEASG
ncbi:hypothetical protein [Glaciihabitans sp. UYNi722]|uniref:hypothetical protein n=1 Tax=Glaciihabitans sp. UYNi722 TaxID=3156344 RepID=UPI003391A01C